MICVDWKDGEVDVTTTPPHRVVGKYNGWFFVLDGNTIHKIGKDIDSFWFISFDVGNMWGIWFGDDWIVDMGHYIFVRVGDKEKDGCNLEEFFDFLLEVKNGDLEAVGEILNYIF